MKLCQYLDAQNSNWRKTSVILIDNASIHRSAEALSYQEELGLNVMFLAPYSFQMAAVEKLFAFMKNRDINPLAVRAYTR